MPRGTVSRPQVKPRYWEWRDRDRNETAGVGLFRGSDLQAHMTPTEARNLADQLHDMADQIEVPTNKENK